MNDDTIQIIFFGDYSPVRGYESMASDSSADMLGAVVPLIMDSDISMVNLESPLCLGGSPISKSGPTLRAHPDCIKPLVRAGFSVVGLANNHIMDYGLRGLEETISLCEREGLKFCGAGRDLLEAMEPLIIERKGKRIAFIAIAEHEFSIASQSCAGAAPLDLIGNLASIRMAKKLADYVIISLHGGNEYFPLPRPGLRRITHFFIDEGADAVICHHPHVPGAFEVHRGKPIVYSLGNFIFDREIKPRGWCKGYAFKLTISGTGPSQFCFDLIPYRQSVSIGGVCLLKSCDKDRFLEDIGELNSILANQCRYESEWKSFCDRKKYSYLNRIFNPLVFRGAGKIAMLPGIKNLLFSQRRRIVFQNIIQCESHCEALLRSLADMR